MQFLSSQSPYRSRETCTGTPKAEAPSWTPTHTHSPEPLTRVCSISGPTHHPRSSTLDPIILAGILRLIHDPFPHFLHPVCLLVPSVLFPKYFRDPSPSLPSPHLPLFLLLICFCFLIFIIYLLAALGLCSTWNLCCGSQASI